MRLAPILGPVLALLTVLWPRPAAADWPTSPTVNLPVCTSTGVQTSPAIAPDDAGGAIVAWSDYRAAGSDIYVQRILASGAVDPTWPLDGRPLCVAVSNQLGPVIAADGSGGAIVAWYDYRGGSTADIYAQHVLAAGAADPAWPPNGRGLCTAGAEQNQPALVADGAGGAIATWQDFRGGTSSDIYAQHVQASGGVDVTWPTDGRALCVATGGQQRPTLVGDGSGGAIVAWQDQRGGSNSDVYAQRVLSSGVVHPGWPADGRALCTASGNQQLVVIVTDGEGGAIATWRDSRAGTSNYDVYAQRVRHGGAVDPAWPADGSAICTAADFQDLAVSMADGTGGIIVAWADRRIGNYDIFAQRVTPSGTLGSSDPVGVPDVPSSAEATLAPPSPNPARGFTTIRFALSSDARVSLDVFDAGGRRVRSLARESRPAGANAVHWDLQDDRGRRVATGLYILRLAAEGRWLTRRVIVAR